MGIRWTFGVVVVLAMLVLSTLTASARVMRPTTLSFDPEKDEFNRYMTVITLGGAITRPGELHDLHNSFRIRAVYRDIVTASLHGLNRHSLSFYDYDTFVMPFTRTREDRRFQQQGQGNRNRDNQQSFAPPSDEMSGSEQGPPPIGGDVMQGGGGGGGGGGGEPPGGGGGAGGEDPTFSVDDILVSSLTYVESKNGDVLDVQGLEQLREYSRRSIVPGEIKLDVGHLFEWNHLLRLPDYPVWREDMWFATIPLNVPGLPKPLLCKFVYRVLGFARIGMRQVAIVDTHGIIDFHEYWEDEDDVEIVKYEAMGDFTIAARYIFDYEQGMIFGVERPRIYDFETNNYFQGDFDRYGDFELKYPGLLANLNMRYYTETTKKPRTKREERNPPEPEPVDRRHVGLTFFMQTEAE
jgi:hypothetical protein